MLGVQFLRLCRHKYSSPFFGVATEGESGRDLVLDKSLNDLDHRTHDVMVHSRRESMNKDTCDPVRSAVVVRAHGCWVKRGSIILPSRYNPVVLFDPFSCAPLEWKILTALAQLIHGPSPL